jgi:FKBP-type peptidyl-prolyl cis-trans isomerase
MQEDTKQTGLLIGGIVVLVVIVAAIGYGFMHTKAPAPASDEVSAVQTTVDSTPAATTTSASLPKTTTKPTTTMQSSDPIVAGKAFLAENAKKPGITTLPDGLQYEVLVAGNGAKPTRADTVKVNYEGTLIDGTVFDSSYKRGEPIEFGVTQVIAGWTEALQLMPVGSTWNLYIPSELAYGSRGAGGAIGPNETLIFKVELLGISK